MSLRKISSTFFSPNQKSYFSEYNRQETFAALQNKSPFFIKLFREQASAEAKISRFLVYIRIHIYTYTYTSKSNLFTASNLEGLKNLEFEYFPSSKTSIEI